MSVHTRCCCENKYTPILMQRHASHQVPAEIRKKMQRRGKREIRAGKTSEKNGIAASGMLNSNCQFFVSADYFHTEISWQFSPPYTHVHANFLRVSHLEALLTTVSDIQRSAGLMPTVRHVGGGFLFIAFRLETAARSERVPVSPQLRREKRLMRFTAEKRKKKR